MKALSKLHEHEAHDLDFGPSDCSVAYVFSFGP